MKKYVKLLVGVLLALGMGVFTACENLPFGNKTSDSVSVETSSSEPTSSSEESLEESSSEESSVEENSSDTTSSENSFSGSIDFPWWPWGSDETSDSSSDIDSDSSSTEDPPTWGPKEPATFLSMDKLGSVYSYSPEGYGVEATLTEVEADYNDCIKGTFNNVGANTYPGEDGGDWVWTFLAIDLPTVNNGFNGDLRNWALKFDLKVVNCSPISSIILFDEDGNRSEEISFNNKGAEDKATFDVSTSYDGWCHFTINLPLIYEADVLDNVSQIAIVFSNAFGNNAVDSTFYVDQLYFCEPSRAWSNPTVYNHAGYYDKDEDLFIMFAGNSFIEFSASAYWLNEMAQANGANLTADYNWTPNGRINNQYTKAFNTYDGYMHKADKPDVIFIQDFYDLSDALSLGSFLEETMFVSPFTEVMVYTADNETEDGILAANHYGLDLVNWRAAIHTLKASLGFGFDNLNYADGASHANELNGVFGAAMAYMQLYGEIPDMGLVWESVLASYGREGDNVADFLPGNTLEEKQGYLSVGLQLCAELCGLDANDICLHQYHYETINDATCENDGLEKGTCSVCGHEIEKTIPATGHSFQNDVCIHCDAPAFIDADDLAATDYLTTSIIDNWIVHSNLSMQTTVVSLNSTSSLRGAFNVNNADTWYDSPEDGGKWVWTAITMDVNALNDGFANLRDSVLTFDIKVINGDVTSSIILLKSDGTRSAQLAFNQDPYNPGVSASSGYTKALLPDGWARITVNFDMLYGADARSVDKIYIIVSNAFGDYVNDTVFYLDNMKFVDASTPAYMAQPIFLDEDYEYMLEAGTEMWFEFTAPESDTYEFYVSSYTENAVVAEEYYTIHSDPEPFDDSERTLYKSNYLFAGETIFIRVFAPTISDPFILFVL